MQINTVDKTGNKLYTVRKSHGDDVYLKLISEKKPRLIGSFYSNWLFTKRNRKIHYHRNTDGYCFCQLALTTIPELEVVSIEDKEGLYNIPLKVVLDNGRIVHHKAQGFEKQISIPITLIESYKVNTHEKVRVS